MALYSLGENALAQREFDQALQYYQEAARRAEEEKDEAILGRSLNKIGATFTSLRQPERAIEFHERALAIHRAENYLPGVVVDLIQAAQSYLDVSDLEQAVACAEELSTLGLRYPPPDREWIPFVVGRVAAAQGDWARAKERFREALITVENRRRLFRSPEAQRR